MTTQVIETFTHLGHEWSVVKINSSFFARDDQGVDTGPYGTAGEAREWVEAIGAA